MDAAAGYEVQLLSAGHERAGFDCGIEVLNRYLIQQAGQDMRRDVARIYVLVPNEQTEAVGYYTLASTSLELSGLPVEAAKKLPRYPQVPAILIGRLALDKRLKGKKLGEYLLLDALAKSLAASERVAAFAVVVDAKDEVAKGFYQRYGFLPLVGHEQRLFLPMKTIQSVLG